LRMPCLRASRALRTAFATSAGVGRPSLFAAGTGPSEPSLDLLLDHGPRELEHTHQEHGLAEVLPVLLPRRGGVDTVLKDDLRVVLGVRDWLKITVMHQSAQIPAPL
jgi:hypothetical protein